MKFTVNMLLTCIIYCDAGLGCLIKTACKYSMYILITDIIFVLARFSSEMPSLYFEKARHLSRDVLITCIYLIELVFLNLDV